MKIKHFCTYHLPFMIMILILGILGSIGCLPEGTADVKITDHKFEHGEIVLTKLDNKKGMIVSRYIYKYRYVVRFAGHNSTYPEVTMQQYELEKYTIVNKDSIISELNRNLTEATNKLAESDKMKEQVKILIIEAEK